MPIATFGTRMYDMIIADGALRTKSDLAQILAVLDPRKDAWLWDYYYGKWCELDGMRAHNRTRRRAV